MKTAHLILTHKNPAQLERLLKALQHPDFDCYVHLDQKTPMEAFAHLQHFPQVFFVKERVSIYWAGYGTIQATINGFREILQKDYDYVNVISGQDFPLCAAQEIAQYLEEHRGTEFITCETVGEEWPESLVRITHYHFINWKIPGKHRLEQWANKILPRRQFPYPFTLVGRANWFTITTEAARYILQTLESEPRLRRFFWFSWGADEIIFSTILYNSPFRLNIQPNLVYVDWRGQHDGHPKILGIEDLPEMILSGKLFARKMDMEKDAAVFKALEERIYRKEEAASS